MSMREKEYKLGELLGYRELYVQKGSCGGWVCEYVWVRGDHALQTAEWYCWSYTGIPYYGRDYDSLLSAEAEVGIVAEPQTFIQRKRKRVWLAYWVGKNMEPLHAPLEARLDALIHALEKIPLTK